LKVTHQYPRSAGKKKLDGWESLGGDKVCAEIKAKSHTGGERDGRIPARQGGKNPVRSSDDPLWSEFEGLR